MSKILNPKIWLMHLTNILLILVACGKTRTGLGLAKRGLDSQNADWTGLVKRGLDWISKNADWTGLVKRGLDSISKTRTGLD